MGLPLPPSLLLLVSAALTSEPLPLPYSRNLNLNTTAAAFNLTTTSQSDLNDEPRNLPDIMSSGPPLAPSAQPVSSPCHAPGTCTPSATPLTCYGAELPYSSSGPSLLSPNTSLEAWAGLQELPACWALVQQILCAGMTPSCSQGRVTKVPRAYCRAALKPCKVLGQVLPSLPDFLDCSNDRLYSDQCSEDTRSKRAKFNASRSCVPPLLHTDIPSAWFPGIEECGIKCQSPILSQAEYWSLHSLVAVGGSLSLTCSLLAVFTFLLDWRGGAKYPALSIFYLNLCLLLVAAGWLAQFSGRQDIVCRQDGTARHAEPGAGENLSCTVVFVMVYYFSIAAAVWLVILAYSWSVAFTSTPGKVQELLASRAAYFHMTAWSLPLVLTILVMATNKVDGSAVSGICFVGYRDRLARIFFVLLPHSAAVLISGLFTYRSLAVLSSLCYGSGSEHLSPAASAKMRHTLARILVFSLLSSLCVLTTLACHGYTWAREAAWEAALTQLVFCNLRRTLQPAGEPQCGLEDSPSLAVLQLELVAVFGGGVLASSWVWTRESINTWGLGLRQLVLREASQRPVKLRKHEIIAQAFSKRNELQANGRLSLSFQSAHDDPLGMDLQVDTSADFSSGWAAALPHLVTRRVGLCGAAQLGLARRHSLDSVSNISRSVSIRSGRFSWLGSRKGSLDSQDIGQTDLDRLQAIYDDTIKSKKRSKREFFRSHRQKLRPWSRLSSRRGSVTSRAGSENSSVFSQVLPAITLSPCKQPKPRKLGGVSLPQPGRSTDFGGRGREAQQEDPSYMELEKRLRQLATSSRNIEGEGVEVGVQASLPSPRLGGVSVATQVSPHLGHKLLQEDLPLPPLLPPGQAPLQHIEANVVNLKVVGPSSEDSSIPSSYEKDFKMKKLSPRGKENSSELQRLDLEEISIPALRPLAREGGAGQLRPRDHYNRGRRGAIVQKLSPGAKTDTTATDS